MSGKQRQCRQSEARASSFSPSVSHLAFGHRIGALGRIQKLRAIWRRLSLFASAPGRMSLLHRVGPHAAQERVRIVPDVLTALYRSVPKPRVFPRIPIAQSAVRTRFIPSSISSRTERKRSSKVSCNYMVNCRAIFFSNAANSSGLE